MACTLPFPHSSRRPGTSLFWLGGVAACLVLVRPCYAAEENLAASDASYSTDAEIIAQINAHIRAGWQAHDVRPSRQATDGEWCRRAYLDLIGRVPTVEELDKFVGKRSRLKRAELVEQLLGEEYAQDYARNWTTLWSNLLIGRTGGMDRQSITSRPGMAEYLEGCFLENKPYHQMVHELVTATGGARPGMADYNGAVNFLVEKLDDGGVQAAAKTAQIFLGMSVQCTQCHNHPFNEHKQNQFWELNAFFRQMRVEVAEYEDNEPRLATLTDADFAGEGKMLGADSRGEVFLEMRNGKLVDRDQGEFYSAPIFYELRNGQLQTAYPTFVDGASLAERFADKGPEFGNSGRVKQVHRRRELAKLMLQSTSLEAAAVNRMWAHFLGYGFTKPVDDMGSHNPASHPELLAELAGHFRASGFDLKRLMRWIVLSEAYGLSSQAGAGNEADDPALGRPPQFSKFYVRQMQPEQLYESLLAATQADAGMKQFDRESMKVRWLDQFTTNLGNDEGAEATTFNGSIPQARIANDEKLSNKEKINYLYRAAVSRLPGKDETNMCNELLASRYGNVVETLQDVWWALLNSNEFILVH
jgi:hypothetical protein